MSSARIISAIADLELEAFEDEPVVGTDAGEAQVVLDVDERAEVEPSAESVNYFGSDFDVHGLVRRMGEQDIVIPTFDPGYPQDTDIRGFQRQFVWRRYQMDRFVESLLLGYPVPGIFLVQQPDNKLLVLDGQQRLRTLEQFYAGRLYDGQEFALEAVSDAFKGLTYSKLADEDRRQLDNTFIHAIIVKYDPDSDQGAEAVYQLFERLNTGGTNLYPHEIRVALYPGKLVDFIRELNQDANWRELYGPPSGRLKDQELILRFIALYLEGDDYARPLKGFLNDFLKSHRKADSLDTAAIETTFRDACKVANDALGRRAFRTVTAVNAALVDAVMIGLARRLERGPITDLSGLAAAYEKLIAEEAFETAIARATADEDRVERRLSMATEAFENIS